MKSLAAAITAALLVALAVAALNAPPDTGAAKRCGRIVPPAPPQPRVFHSGSLDELFPSGDVPRDIPDGPGGVVTSTVTVPTDVTITDLNVQLSITHTWIRDLRLSLIGPDSTEVVLLDLFPGDSLINMTNTWFNDESAIPIIAGNAPFTGSYRPQSPLTAFDGMSSAGVWTLRIEDHFALDTGTLDAWTLEVNPPVNLAGTIRDGRTQTPLEGVHVDVLDSVAQAFTDANGYFGIEGVPAGTYTVRFSRAYFDTLFVTGAVIPETGVLQLDRALASPFIDFHSSADPVDIPDTNFAGAVMTLSVRDPLSIRDLDVTVNIEHTYVGDLSLVLINPVGDSVMLVPIPVPCPPSSGADIIDCRFDDAAAQEFSAGEAPYTGAFRPAEPLAAFSADSTRDSTAGPWTLWARDTCPDDVGRILGFTLHFLPTALAVVPPAAAAALPRAFDFAGAYPNPFNSRTVFRFTLARPEHLRLTLYNTLGQQAAVVADGVFPAGSHQLSFDAGNLASGLYFARLSAAGGAAQSRKLVLLR